MSLIQTVRGGRPRPEQRPYTPRGRLVEAFYDRSEELMISGPAGTGKSRCLLEKLYACAAKYPGFRGLMVRRSRKSLTQSGMVTFERYVLPEGWQRSVRFHHEDQEYRLSNGSVIVVGGLGDADEVSRLMSTEFDVIYVQEARELTEHQWEMLSSRLRNRRMPWQQIAGDTNPDAPKHWIRQRAMRGRLRLVESRHEDNPELFDERSGQWTPFGLTYIARLDRLTGVRHARLRRGLWVAAEGQVYEAWDPAVHVVPRVELPPEWPRLLAIDFGYTNPFCAQWWARDPDGRLYRYRELYQTQVLVEDHAHRIRALSAGERLVAAICDHDAEDRATLARHLVCRCPGVDAPPLPVELRPAIKDIGPGIQAVQARLRPAGDGRPRLLFLEDSLVERDEALDEQKLPACTEEEFEMYVWRTVTRRDQRGREVVTEEPIDDLNHGLDCVRYVVAAHDLAAPARRTMARFGGR